MITHIVLFKLKDRSEENVDNAKQVLLSLAGRVPQLRYIEVGTDVLHSERSYDLALVTKFNSLDDLQAYQVHPEHLKVAEFIGTVRETAVVVDYES